MRCNLGVAAQDGFEQRDVYENVLSLKKAKLDSQRSKYCCKPPYFALNHLLAFGSERRHCTEDVDGKAFVDLF